MIASAYFRGFARSISRRSAEYAPNRWSGGRSWWTPTYSGSPRSCVWWVWIRWPLCLSHADDYVVERATRLRRILLTRDRRLMERRALRHAYFVRSQMPERQLSEVVLRFDLGAALQPFSRCMVCNGVLRPIAKARVAERLPPRVRQLQETFSSCQACGRLAEATFWTQNARAAGRATSCINHRRIVHSVASSAARGSRL